MLTAFRADLLLRGTTARHKKAAEVRKDTPCGDQIREKARSGVFDRRDLTTLQGVRQGTTSEWRSESSNSLY
ncbi:hypothetical protein FBQ95_14005 [Chloroflexi bacterium CFX3]|nr:hypothetical protein [Chloroflexi bacterium CFX3]